MATEQLSNPSKFADRAHSSNGRAEPEACSPAPACLAGEDLLDAVVWDLAALDKFRRYFLPKDTAGPPGYEVDEDVVLGEIRRLARHEPLTFRTCAPSWARGGANTVGYATLGDWCAFAICQRDRGRLDRSQEASGTYKPYAVIGTFAPIGPGHDWRQIDVNSLSGRVLAYAVLLTKDAAPGYARAAGMRVTASLNRVRAHFFHAVANYGRVVREAPSGAIADEQGAAGFLVLDEHRVFPILRRDPDSAHLKRPHPFYVGGHLAGPPAADLTRA